MTYFVRAAVVLLASSVMSVAHQHVLNSSCIMSDSIIQVSVDEWIDSQYTSECHGDHISTWITSNVTNMDYLFCGAYTIESCRTSRQAFNGDLSGWNVQAVTSMVSMFEEAAAFEGHGLKHWEPSNVRSFERTFAFAPIFKEDVSSWDVSRATNFNGTFWGATLFDADISHWNVMNATSMGSIFRGASKFDADISLWNVTRVNELNFAFYGASTFNNDLSEWNVQNAVTMYAVFGLATSLSECNKRFIYDSWEQQNPSAFDYPTWASIPLCFRSYELALYGIEGPRCGFGTSSCSCDRLLLESDSNRLACDDNPDGVCGSIPAAVGDCVNLTSFSLQILRDKNVVVAGSVPTEISRLTSLRTLDLGSQRLTGPLPSGIASLVALEEIRLESNAFGLVTTPQP
eukprot:g1036.t1